MRILLLFFLLLPLYGLEIKYNGKIADVVPGDVLIQLKENGNKANDHQRIRSIFSDILKTKNLDDLNSNMLFNTGRYAIHRATLSKLAITQFIAAAKSHPEVESIQPNFIYKTMEHHREYYFTQRSSRWNYDSLNVPMAHALIDQEGAWNPNITIAVLDTGIYPRHPAFNSIVDPYSIYFVFFYYGSEVYTSTEEYDAPIMGMKWDPAIGDYATYTVTGGYHDWQGHGTHCAGLVASNFVSNKDFYGIAPTYRVMPVKVMDDDGIGNTAVIIQGAMYALEMGADVLSMSLGSDTPDPFAEQIYMQEIYGRGIPIIAAAGNSYELGNLNNYPAAYASTIAVASLGSDDRVAYYSQSHDWVDIAAPGGDGKKKNKSGKQRQIFSTWTADPRAGHKPFSTPMEPGEDRKYYAGISGTSMATPQIAGIVALMRGIDYSLTPDQILAILQGTGTQVIESYYPKQIQKMAGLRKADAYQAIKFLLDGDNPEGPVMGSWKTVHFEIDPNFPTGTFFLDRVRIAINNETTDLFNGPRIDLAQIEGTLALPAPAPYGGQKMILKLSFSGTGYIPEKSVYLHNLGSMGYILHRNYSSYPKFTAMIAPDEESQSFVISVRIDK